MVFMMLVGSVVVRVMVVPLSPFPPVVDPEVDRLVDAFMSTSQLPKEAAPSASILMAKGQAPPFFSAPQLLVVG